MRGIKLFHQPLDVGALRFGKAGGRQADQRGLVLFANGLESEDHVLVRAHHGGDLIHRGGLQRDGLAKVAHEVHLAEGGTTLRAVHHRDRAMDAEEGQRRADRLAGLERIHRERLVAFQDFGHVMLLPPTPPLPHAGGGLGRG